MTATAQLETMIATIAPVAQAVALPTVGAGATRRPARVDPPPEGPATARRARPLGATTAQRIPVVVAATARPTAVVVVATARPTAVVVVATARRLAVVVRTAQRTVVGTAIARPGAGLVLTGRLMAVAATGRRVALVARTAATAVETIGQPRPATAVTLAVMLPHVGTEMVGRTAAPTSRGQNGRLTALRTAAAAIVRIVAQRAVHGMGPQAAVVGERLVGQMAIAPEATIGVARPAHGATTGRLGSSGVPAAPVAATRDATTGPAVVPAAVEVTRVVMIEAAPGPDSRVVMIAVVAVPVAVAVIRVGMIVVVLRPRVATIGRLDFNGRPVVAGLVVAATHAVMIVVVAVPVAVPVAVTHVVTTVAAPGPDTRVVMTVAVLRRRVVTIGRLGSSARPVVAGLVAATHAVMTVAVAALRAVAATRGVMTVAAAGIPARMTVVVPGIRVLAATQPPGRETIEAGSNMAVTGRPAVGPPTVTAGAAIALTAGAAIALRAGAAMVQRPGAATPAAPVRVGVVVRATVGGSGEAPEPTRARRGTPANEPVSETAVSAHPRIAMAAIATHVGTTATHVGMTGAHRRTTAGARAETVASGRPAMVTAPPGTGPARAVRAVGRRIEEFASPGMTVQAAGSVPTSIGGHVGRTGGHVGMTAGGARTVGTIRRTGLGWTRIGPASSTGRTRHSTLATRRWLRTSTPGSCRPRYARS